MLQALAIIELIIQVILLRAKIISMGLRTFGIRQKEYCGNTMVLTEMPFRYLLRNVNLDSIMAVQSNSLKHYRTYALLFIDSLW